MKTLITEKDLEARVTGDEFAVAPDMLLTPSARDFASRNGIRLIYPDSAVKRTETDMERAIREAVAAELGQEVPEVVAAVRAGLGGQTGQPASGQADISAQVLKRTESTRTSRAVLSTVGANRTGILGRLTGIMAKLECDIHDVSQTIVSGYFTMILVVDITEYEARGGTFGDFRKAVLAETAALGLESMLMHEDVLTAMHRV